MNEKEESNRERSRKLLAEIEKMRGSLSDAHRIAAHDPDTLDAYKQIYSTCFQSVTAIPEKYKQLFLVAIGVATLRAQPVDVHARAALDLGATAEELAGAVRIGILQSGIPGFIVGAQALRHLGEPPI